MFKLPALAYSYDALEPWIDEKTMRFHHDKHHGTYVDNLNSVMEKVNPAPKADVSAILKNLSSYPKEIREKIKNNAGGHYNHTLFWQIMGPPAELIPQGNLKSALNASFTNLDIFKEKFSLAGLNRFGSGWVWLVIENGNLSIIDSINQDTPVSDGKIPILCLDVWEHAYYLKYQNRRADYINSWWNVVNWRRIEELYEIAKNKNHA